MVGTREICPLLWSGEWRWSGGEEKDLSFAVEVGDGIDVEGKRNTCPLLLRWGMEVES